MSPYLLHGGKPQPCGWLKDQFGLSWQVSPIELHTLLAGPDYATSQRVFAAMMQMQKLDIAALRDAAKG